MAERGVRPSSSSLEDTKKSPTGAFSEPLCLFDLVAEKETSYVTERI